MNPSVTIDIADGIARIGMDDGKVNAMSTNLMNQLSAALDAAEAADAVVVLSGREGIFSAGFDLRTFDRGAEAGFEMVHTGAQLIVRLLSFPLPILTVCTGHAYPMGAFLMMSADSRIGIDGPWRIGMNEVAIGLTVPKFAVELARHRLTAPGLACVNVAAMHAPLDAMRLGYLDRVVAPEKLAECIDEEATRLRTLDIGSFRGTKARINQPALTAITAAIEDEYGATNNTMTGS